MEDLDNEYYEVRQPYISPTERYGLDSKVLKKLYNLNRFINEELLDIAKKEGEYAIYKSQLEALENKYNATNLVYIKKDMPLIKKITIICEK